jgi:hypothetical protein
MTSSIVAWHPGLADEARSGFLRPLGVTPAARSRASLTLVFNLGGESGIARETVGPSDDAICFGAKEDAAIAVVVDQFVPDRSALDSQGEFWRGFPL